MHRNVFLIICMVFAFATFARVDNPQTSLVPEWSHVQFEIHRTELKATPDAVRVQIYGRTDSVFVRKEAELDISDVDDAAYVTDEYGRPAINIFLTRKGRAKMSNLLKTNLHKQLAIFLDGKLIMAPLVDSANMKGPLGITGEIEEMEARRIVARLKQK